METVGNMKLYTFEEVLDKQLGKKGTPRLPRIILIVFSNPSVTL
jgi:hypothetical protein